MREPIFEAIKAARGKGFTAAEVAQIDAFLTSISVPGDGQGRVVSKAGLSLIKEFEGLSLKAYPDPATGGDPWTIGYGATGPGISKGLIWSQAQADNRLADDVSRFADGVSALVGSAPTTQGQYDSLVSWAYNVGLAAVRDSTLLKKHMAGDYDGAAKEFLRWNKAAGKVMAGLTRRREAEAKLYRGGA